MVPPPGVIPVMRSVGGAGGFGVGVGVVGAARRPVRDDDDEPGARLAAVDGRAGEREHVSPVPAAARVPAEAVRRAAVAREPVAVDPDDDRAGLRAQHPDSKRDLAAHLAPVPGARRRQFEGAVRDDDAATHDVVPRSVAVGAELEHVDAVLERGRVQAAAAGECERRARVDRGDAAVDGELDPADAAGRLRAPGDDPAERRTRQPRRHAQRRLPRGEVADERQVRIPVPVPAGIRVVARAAEASTRPGHLRVADHVDSVDRQQRAACQPGGQAGRGAELCLGEPGRVAAPPFVLDPDRLAVDPRVARVPGDVGEVDELDDPAVPRDDEVRGGVGAVASQPADRAPEAALGDVDHDPPDRERAAMRLGVVPLALEPRDGWTAQGLGRCAGARRAGEDAGADAQRAGRAEAGWAGDGARVVLSRHPCSLSTRLDGLRTSGLRSS